MWPHLHVDAPCTFSFVAPGLFSSALAGCFPMQSHRVNPSSSCNIDVRSEAGMRRQTARIVWRINRADETNGQDLRSSGRLSRITLQNLSGTEFASRNPSSAPGKVVCGSCQLNGRSRAQARQRVLVVLSGAAAAGRLAQLGLRWSALAHLHGGPPGAGPNRCSEYKFGFRQRVQMDTAVDHCALSTVSTIVGPGYLSIYAGE